MVAMRAGAAYRGWRSIFGLRAALILYFGLSAQAAWADGHCQVVPARTSSPAEQAFLAADYNKSVSLFQTELAGHPNDPELTAGFVRVLLRQQKVKEALDAVAAALAVNANSGVLLTAKAEVEYREGVPWDSAQSLKLAFHADPCLPRMHLLYSRIARLNSLYESARTEIESAHKLDPNDPDIWGDWIGTLSARERVVELEKYLKSQTGDDAEERHRTQLYLDHSKKGLEEPHKPCRLVSSVASTSIPFASLMRDATHIRAFGLDVRLNQKRARLEIDTGAGGLTITRGVAKAAGLKEYTHTEVGGIGDHGENSAYTAYVDSIQIGDLEFHDCAVEVVDNKRMMEIDGLIGMDVFSKFLVTLDYPERKLWLGPLPPRPGESVVAPTLGTQSSSDDAEPAGNADPNAPAATPAKAAAAADAASAPSTDQKAKSAPTKGPHNRYVAPEMTDYTPVYREGHLLMLPVSLNHQKVKLFVLDTGAWATSISPSAAREVTKVHSDSNLRITGLSGEVEKAYSADEVTFLFARIAQKIQQVPSFDLTNISKHTGMEISGFLGARTLKQVTIHIDYRDGLVKFDYDPKKVSAFDSF